jgi:cytoskeletal protein CcmA (bactofilin family)
MWFKQTEPKSPEQPEAPAVRPQPAPAPYAAPAAPAESAPAATSVAPVAAAFTAGASRITPGLSLKGEISGREDLWIGGRVEGSLRFEASRVVVGAGGTIHGGVEAREIVVEGRVEGDLRATERLEITQTGKVRGDASATRLSMQEGAVFNGTIEVVRAGESRSTLAGAASSSRAAAAPRNARFQTVQAAAATAGTSPAGSPAGVTGGAPDSKESEAAPTGTIAYRGIAADAPKRPE